MQTVETFVVMLVIMALMYPKTNAIFCGAIEKVSFGYAKCDNAVGMMVCMALMMALMVYQNRWMYPSPTMYLPSPVIPR
jgi:hypothetical protein